MDPLFQSAYIMLYQLHIADLTALMYVETCALHSIYVIWTTITHVQVGQKLIWYKIGRKQYLTVLDNYCL